MNWLYGLHLVLRIAFIFLVYYSLFIVLDSVRNEMMLHTRRKGRTPNLAVMGSLRVVHPGGDSRLVEGQSFPLKSSTMIGSAEPSDIILHDPFVSREHARIWWDGAKWLLEDANSRNGTLLNKEACEQPTPITQQDKIGIGDVVLQLV